MQGVTINKCGLGDATHIIIKTGYGTHQDKLLRIECMLRNKMEAETDTDMTCLYACDVNWLLGVLIPNPAGFKKSPYSIPKKYLSKTLKNHDKAVEYILSTTEEMIENIHEHPYYGLAKQSYDHKVDMYNKIYKEQNNSRFDLYLDLFDTVQTLTAEPVEPDKEYTTDLAQKLSKSKRKCDERLYFVDEDDNPSIMPYNARLSETQEIINLLGGIDNAHGTVCFKCDKENAPNPIFVETLIKRNDLSYCAVFDLEGIECITNDTHKIIILDYDAEHG